MEHSISLKIIISLVFVVCCAFSVKETLGRYYFQKFFESLSYKQEEKAFTYADKALQQDFLSLRYLNQFGYFFAKTGYCKDKAMVRKAIKFYETSLGINPNQIELLESLGAFYIYLGDSERGVQYYCRAIKCLPANTSAYIQLLDVLKHCHQQELYTQWLGLLSFINPRVLFSQPDLIESLHQDKEAQMLCLNYFNYLEEKYPDEERKDAWYLEKFLREKLFYAKAQKLNLKSYNLLKWVNWMRGLNWETLISTAKKQSLMKRFYFMGLGQHSNPNILFHGHERPINVATLKEVYGLYPLSIYYTDYGSLRDYVRKNYDYAPSPKGLAIFDCTLSCLEIHACYSNIKHSRELVKPLLEATLRISKDLHP